MPENVDTRLLQANERTLLAWIRTGLAIMAFGYVIDRLAVSFRSELHEDETLSLLLGSAAILVGAACQVIGALRFVAMRRALLAARPFVPGLAGPLAVAVFVSLLGVMLLVYLLAG